MPDIFIAPKIKVGFQKREDCYTQQLAYVIYYDNKGKLRKEISWESWRDKTISPLDFENSPIEGFVINKDIKRYNGDWFSSKRTMIRVYDPRGFEFEITTENLIAILMHTDCLRRGLIGKFVYAWCGAELVLLPVSSEEYRAAQSFTNGLSKRVYAKDIVPGISYRTKKRSENVIYLGKFNWYSYTGESYYPLGIRQPHKAYIFSTDDKRFFESDSLSFLSEANNNTPVSNYADLVDGFNKKIYANNIIKYEMRPTIFNPNYNHDKSSGNFIIERPFYYIKQKDGTYIQITVEANHKWDNIKRISEFIGYSYYKNMYINIQTGEIQKSSDSKYSYYYNSFSSSLCRDKILSLVEMDAIQLYDLFITFENGKTKQINRLEDLNSTNDI